MPNRTLVDDSEKESHAKTSLKMTRSMSNDIGLKIKKILEDIYNGTVNLSYSEWHWLITTCWNDKVWIAALNKAIYQASIDKIDLNKNGAFLQLITEMTPSELKEELRRTHPIATMSLMDLVDKKPPEPKKPKTIEELWP